MMRKENSQTITRQRSVQLRAKLFCQIIFCLMFFVVCSVPLFAMAMGYQSPNLEKRTLAQKPAILADGQINFQYTHEFEQYFGDQFPLRSYMISGWHSLKQFLFQQSGSERVITGDDGWLFFADTLNDYLAAEPLSEVEFNRLDRIITLQRDWLRRRGIDFIFTVAPNKNSIYGEKMPDNFVPLSEKNVAEKLKQSLPAANYLDLFAPLQELAAVSDLPVYHQLDSHWNNLGARQASIAIIERAKNIKTDMSAANLPGPAYEPHKDWVGDLAVMIYPSGPPYDWQYYFFDREAYRYTRPLRSLDDMLIQTRFDQGEYNLLMYRDSFANALIPMLSHIFSEALYSRALPFDYSLLDDFAADLVVVEIAERNLNQLLAIPPRLAADPVGQVPFIPNETDKATLAAEDIFFEAEYDQDLLKIIAWFSGPSIQDADRIIVSLPGLLADDSGLDSRSDRSAQEKTFYEAFPIINPADLDDGTANEDRLLTEHGMTIYLADMQWQATQQNMEIFFHNSRGWQTFTISITLPAHK